MNLKIARWKLLVMYPLVLGLEIWRECELSATELFQKLI